MHEIAIRGGTVVDGTGAKRARLDVGIAGGRIAEIGPNVRGACEIDATARIVAPGFIDIHTHYDPQVLWDRALTPSSWQGVTSVVAGNCGYSIAPTRVEGRGSLMRTLDKVEDMRLETLEAGIRWDFETYGQYLDAIGRAGVAINFGGYVGHTPVRAYVLGDDAYERKATEVEIAEMKRVVADSIRGGALGFSSDRAGFHIGDGGRPVPSVMSSQEELEALASVPAELGQGVVHIATGEDFHWIYAFQRRLGTRVNWSAILTYPPSWKSRAPYQDKLAHHLAERAKGADVHAQVTCRPIVQQIMMREPTAFYQMPAFAELAALPHADRPRLFGDRAWRARVDEQFDSRKWIDPGWPTFTIAESRTHPELLGRSVAEIARERGVAPFDVVCDVALADDLLTRFEIVFANDDVEGVSKLLTAEGCILGLSDAGAHVGQICDAVMPTDFLARWVRDRSLMSVERGIHKLTGEIAHVLGLPNRGILRSGMQADVVVLDWERLAPGPIRRVVDMPAGGDRLVADSPGGIDHVLVNGLPIRSEGRSLFDRLERWPGQILRSVAA